MDTESRASGLKKKRRIFGWVFSASILVFASNMIWTMAPMSLPQNSAPINGNPPHTSSPMSDTGEINTAIVVSVVSLLTSVTSLIGFFSTTVLAWRKEKRETVSAELEIRKKELELEKLKMELAREDHGAKDKST